MAEILLYTLSDKFLITVELVTDIIKRTPVFVITVGCYWEYLIVSFDFQFLVHLQSFFLSL